MYQNIFTLDEISFKARKTKKEASPEYALNNYNYYEPNLEKDFYLRVFIKKALFELDIFELEDFLNFQYENSKNKDKFIKALKLKVLPSIEKIINNASFSLEGGSYFNQTELEDGFVKSDNVIKHREFEFHMFYHWTACSNLIDDLKERKAIFSDYSKTIDSLKDNNNPKLLNWCGKPSHLAFLIRNLVDEGYITGPLGNNKEINNTELSRQILSSFSIKNKTTINTLTVYVNSDSDKHTELRENFNNQGFHLPNSGILG